MLVALFFLPPSQVALKMGATKNRGKRSERNLSGPSLFLAFRPARPKLAPVSNTRHTPPTPEKQPCILYLRLPMETRVLTEESRYFYRPLLSYTCVQLFRKEQHNAFYCTANEDHIHRDGVDRDHTDRGSSKKPMIPCPDWINRFL